MDFDRSLFINFTPVIFSLNLIFIVVLTVFWKLRQRYPVKVNCWFCNSNAKIQRCSLDWWCCPNCEQYNGFSKDGDYNYVIQEQYKVNKNKTNATFYSCQRNNSFISQGNLCEECNRKEEFKLLKLREFEDSGDVRSEKEIAKFEKSFEKKYPLCLKCQSIVQQVLSMQALWLTQYKMLFFKQKPVKKIIENYEKIEKILRLLLCTFASAAIYFIEAWYVPLCGIFLQAVVLLISPIGKRYLDLFLIFGWTGFIWIRLFSTADILKIFKIYSDSNWSSVDDNAYYHFTLALGTAVGLANLKFQSHKTVLNRYLTFKKLESIKRNDSISPSPSPETTVLQSNQKYNNESRKNLFSPVHLTDTLMTNTSVETPIPLKPINSLENKEISLLSHHSYTSSSLGQETKYSFSENSSNQNFSFNESLSSLNSLSLGTKSKTSQTYSPKIFETQTYSSTSPELFNKRYSFKKKTILAPAKLRSMTQTSWVAGGYWQSGMDAPTLSRSSSQSSGFGSSGSNYGPSREPSVYEFDQCSVASEHSCFTGPDSTLPSRISMNPIRQSNCSPRCSQMSEVAYPTESFLCHRRNDFQCNGHTTIVSNPVWLQVLLCGSLVVNMIVLCTILLH